MGIWDRLGKVIKSYGNYSDERVWGRNASKRQADPDLDAAYEELDEFLQGEHSEKKEKSEERKQPVRENIPENIKEAFAELGLKPNATIEECKEAYKKLLKIHHPDRHAKHQGNMEKATDKTARVNAAFELLMKWLKN
jgi:DnaJ-domain-containing protein 1